MTTAMLYKDINEATKLTPPFLHKTAIDRKKIGFFRRKITFFPKKIAINLR